MLLHSLESFINSAWLSYPADTDIYSLVFFFYLIKGEGFVARLMNYAYVYVRIRR